jgi:hypothetical protein
MGIRFSLSKSAESSKGGKSAVAVVDAPEVSPGQNIQDETASGVSAKSRKRPVQEPPAAKERRTQKRARVKLAARIGPADLISGQCCEIIATVNASRQSLYFITDSEVYHLGMRLRVNFPYDPAHRDLTSSDDYGEVVRTERLPDNRIGVAVQIGKPARPRPGVRVAPKSTMRKGGAEERRASERHSFSAEAVVIDLYGSMRIQSRCSDLSLQGCYVDTLNPFPEGTLVRVELHTGGKEFEAIAVVNSSLTGMGMGLHFQDLRPDQSAVLTYWLSSEPSGRMWVEGGSNTPPKKPESSDRALAINIIRDMIAKGILTKADISDIFFGNGSI